MTSCVDGEFCPLGADEPEYCPPGHYCIDTGSNSHAYPEPMAGGMYVNEYQYASSTGETCPAGFFCPAGTSMPKKCTPGYYCGEGLTAPVNQCGTGTFSGADAIADAGECNACWIGHYCEAGV
jgi:hypothetical protein